MAQLLSVGAACNVTYLFVMETDTLTGPAAVKRSVHAALTRPPSGLDPLMVHFKVSDKGITLTDNKRKRFFRYKRTRGFFVKAFKVFLHVVLHFQTAFSYGEYHLLRSGSRRPSMGQRCPCFRVRR